jgi:hypothetical protein
MTWRESEENNCPPNFSLSRYLSIVLEWAPKPEYDKLKFVGQIGNG